MLSRICTCSSASYSPYTTLVLLLLLLLLLLLSLCRLISRNSTHTLAKYRNVSVTWRRNIGRSSVAAMSQPEPALEKERTGRGRLTVVWSLSGLPPHRLWASHFQHSTNSHYEERSWSLSVSGSAVAVWSYAAAVRGSAIKVGYSISLKIIALVFTAAICSVFYIFFHSVVFSVSE